MTYLSAKLLTAAYGTSRHFAAPQIRSLSDAKRLAPEDEEWERRRRPIVVVAALILRWRRTVPWVICGQRHRLGARHRRRPGIGDSAAQHHGRAGHLFPRHQFPQRGSVLHRQPNAAVRHRMSEIALLVGAMHGVAGLCEENRIRHRRIVPLLAVVVDVHAEWLKGAARRVVAASPGRHRPVVKLIAVDRYSHA